MRLSKLSLSIIGLILQVGSLVEFAAAEAPYVPDQLYPWIEWVSQQHSELRCATVEGSNVCLWPGKIDLEVSNGGARFKIIARVDFDSTLALPGTDSAKAHNVEIKTLSAKGAGYLESGDMPSIQLEPGEYEISGNLNWTDLPETLNLPTQVGLVRLVRDGKLIDRPHFEGNTIWLGGITDKPVREADALSISSVRSVSDGAPFVISTTLRLRVAGSARQLALPGFLPSGFAITAINTSLPYQLTPQGSISLQISAGEHVVTVTAQSASAPSSISFPKVEMQEWPAQEFVSWRPDPSFRSVAVSGGVLTDASRTELPAEWQQGSIYALKAGEAFELSEQARGEQAPQITQLSLQRNVWLHGDGSGFTASDIVRGFSAAPWRLDLNSEFKLGQAAVDGTPQVITSNPEGGMSGVEFRSANLNLATTFVSDQYADIPANGWNREVDSSNVSVHLPAGWKVLAAIGADSASNTIVARWSLADLLIIVALVGVSAILFGVYGALAMTALSLVFHGGSAELQIAWIGLIVGCLGLKYLAPGRLRLLARIYTALIVACLLLLAPAILSQLAEIFVPSAGSGLSSLRLRGLAEVAYSLLERTPYLLVFAALVPWSLVLLYGMNSSRRLKISLLLGAGLSICIVLFIFSSAQQTFYRVDSIIGEGSMPVPQSVPAPAPAVKAYERSNQPYDGGMQQAVRQRNEQAFDMLELKESDGTVAADRLAAGSGAGYGVNPQRAFQEIDPRAVVQTGPGVPLTSGPTIELRWNNKVASDERVKLIYIAPFFASLLTLLGVAAMAIVWLKAFRRVRQSAWAGVILLLMVANYAHAQAYPSSEILNDLQQRLLNARCTQNCVAIDSVRVRVDGERAAISMRVSSQGVGAVALPGPLSELILSDLKIGAAQSAALLRTDNDVLYARVPDGISQIEMSAAFVDPNEAAITFNQSPHFVAVEASGWQIDGLSPEGLVRGNLHLARSGVEGPAHTIEGSKRSGAKLPQWYTIDRSLRIGLNWLTTTTITRSGSSSDTATSVQIPLLAGESVLTAGLNVSAGNVEIPFAYGQNSYAFESKIAPSESLLLKATAIANTTEVWNVACSTIWQCKASGLNPTYSQLGVAQAWRWRPFPGEEVKLALAKPLGIEGQTSTVDSVNYELTPDARSTAIVVRASVRESQSQSFGIELPPEITPEKLFVSGAPQVLRREGNRLIVNLPAGTSQIELRASVAQGWQALLSTPSIKVGESAVNLSTKILASSSRWNVFAGGDGSGPVMLWWGKLALLVLFALVLVKFCKIELSLLHAAVLMFGFAILPVETAVWPFFWLALIAWRARSNFANRLLYIGAQMGVVLVGLLTLWTCWSCIAFGLSRAPNMLIASSNAPGSDLIWSLQRAAGVPPQAWLLSFPLALWQAIFVLWLGLSVAILVRNRAWIISCLKPQRFPQAAK